jgi:ribosome-associated protein
MGPIFGSFEVLMAGVSIEEATAKSAQPQLVALNAQRQPQLQHTLEQACLAARVLEDTRGQETLVLDLTQVTPIVDYFVVTTGASPRQMKAMAEEVHQVLKKSGSRRIGSEGEESSPWVLQDYGDLVIHIFTTDARKLYDLEHLWADATQVDWKAIAPPVAPRL